MEKLVFILIHLGLPFLILTDFFFRKPKSNIGLLAKSILYAAILYFLFLWVQWPLVGSYYLRYLMLLLIICITGRAFVWFRSGNLGKPKQTSNKNSYVKEGTPLGLVGISGFSQETHLHFQPAVYNKDSVLVGIPIKLKGRTLSRNDLYRN